MKFSMLFHKLSKVAFFFRTKGMASAQNHFTADTVIEGIQDSLATSLMD